MRILYLDLATRTGYAVGPAGEKPYVSTVKLRKHKDDELFTLSNNLGYFLNTVCAMHSPDLIAYEAPLDPAAKNAMAEAGENSYSGGRPQNSASVILPWMLIGVVHFFADLKDIRIVKTNRQQVLKHFTGRRTWGGRPHAKKAVIARCHQLKLLPETCKDDDMADAIAGHDYVSHTLGRAKPRELVMFGGKL